MKLFYFGSEDCTQCRAMKEEIKTIPYAEMPEDSFEEWNITVLPTLVLMKGGSELERITGFHTFKQVEELVQKYN